MEFIEHSIDWCRGEIFEGAVCALYGLGIIIVSLIFWKLGVSPFARALFVPLLVVGLFYGLVGVGVVLNNRHRIQSYTQSYGANPAEFKKSETERIQRLVKSYPVTKFIVSVIIVIGLILNIILGGATGRSIALAVILFGFSFLIMDYFSEERAGIYNQRITANSETEKVR